MAYPESLRARLPKDESYPLNRERIDSALTQAGVERVDLVYFLRPHAAQWRRVGSGPVVKVDYRPRFSSFGERIDVRIYAVPVDEKARIRAALDDGVLPRVAEWIRAAETAGDGWRATAHSIAVGWSAGSVTVSEV